MTTPLSPNINIRIDATKDSSIASEIVTERDRYIIIYIKSFAMLIFFLLSIGNTHAQSPPEHKSENLFKGTWVNKKTTRHLRISFQDGYATITDWTSKLQRPENGDIYKAFLKNGRLVMPEDTDHHAPYSEIILKNKTLIYLTKPMDVGTTTQWDQQVFTRVLKHVNSGHSIPSKQ